MVPLAVPSDNTPSMPTRHRTSPGFRRHAIRRCITSGTVLLGALAACSTPRESPSASLEQLGDHLARTVCPGPPARVQSVRNQHMPEQTDRLETRECPAGTSVLYMGQTTSKPAGLALAVEILAPRSGLPPHLEVGHPVDRAIEVLGTPQGQAPGAATYGLGLEGINTVVIRHSAGKITSVEWNWVID